MWTPDGLNHPAMADKHRFDFDLLNGSASLVASNLLKTPQASSYETPSEF
jgi:hypothetical protein